MVRGSPYRVDWTNLDEVIAYAKKLGKGVLVTKHEGRPNYNITHIARKDLYTSEEVVWSPNEGYRKDPT